MASAKLFIQDSTTRGFVFHSDWHDDSEHKHDGIRGELKARNEGERLSREGSVYAFQVWSLMAQFEVVREIREVTPLLVAEKEL